MATPAFLRADNVLLVLLADPEKNLQKEYIECVILEGDTGREGQLIRADTYVLQARQGNEARDINNGKVISGVKLESMIHM